MAQSVAENLDSPGEILNEQNMLKFFNLLGEMSQKNQNNEKLSKALNSLSKIAKEYKNVQNAAENLDSPSELLNEQNLITVLNSLNEMAQEYEKQQDSKPQQATAPSNSVAATPSKPAFTAPPGSAAAKWEKLANSNNCRSSGGNANCATILQQWGQELYKLEESNNAGHDGSLPIFLDYVKYFPDAPAAPNMLFQSAFILESKGELNQAFELRQTFVKKYPNHVLATAAWLRIGEYYYNNSKWADAINAYEKVANAPANSPREKKEASYAIYHLAESHYNLGNYDVAAQKFSEYIDGANKGKYIEDLRNEAKDYLSHISK